MKKSRTIAALLIGVMLLLTFIAGCAAPKGTDNEMNDPKRDWEPIETKFGRLRYPDDLFQFLETEQKEAEDTVAVMFRAAIGDRRIDLFELTIGNVTGEAAGKITGPDGVVRDVSLRFIPADDLSGLSEGEQNRVYAMQEALNFVLDHMD